MTRKSSRFLAVSLCALGGLLWSACPAPSPSPDVVGSSDVNTLDQQSNLSDVVDVQQNSDASVADDVSDTGSSIDVVGVDTATLDTQVADLASPDVVSMDTVGNDTAFPDAQTTDAQTADACGPSPVPPDLAGAGVCATLDFGLAPAAVANVTTPMTFDGGSIPPGIYDVVGVSRTTGSISVQFQATLVLSADGRFTEVRQLTTGSPGPVTRRSGSWASNGSSLDRVVTCNNTDAGTETMTAPYRIESSCTETLLHLGTTNLWFTYRLRTLP